jgi:hypothetical protein
VQSETVTVILTEKTDVPGPWFFVAETSTRSLLGEEVERRTQGLRLRQRLQRDEGASTVTFGLDRYLRVQLLLS